MENKMHPFQHHTNLFDLVPLGVIAASMTDVVPSVAAVFAILWYCVLLWESETVRKMTGREVVYDDDRDDYSDYDDGEDYSDPQAGA